MDDMPVIEPFLVEDDLVSKLWKIEDVGDFALRFVVVTKQTVFEAPYRQVWIVKRKIVLPFPEVVPALEMTAEHAARRIGNAVKKRVLSLVR